jgi:hypothetical protein
MAINPELITTIRVDQLPDEALSLTNLFPHTVGTDLKSATIQELVDLVATTIGVSGGVGYIAISVTDGQQLPDVPELPSFFLCGAGTFLNINGYPDVICTDELNAVMSLSDHWELAVGIPIVAEVGVQTVTGSAVDNTDPLNPVINEIISGVQNIIAGTNITVDNTDPANPIVSSTGGGTTPTLQEVATEGNTLTDTDIIFDSAFSNNEILINVNDGIYVKDIDSDKQAFIEQSGLGISNYDGTNTTFLLEEGFNHTSSGGFQKLTFDTIASDEEIIIPNASGTLALTSDIPTTSGIPHATASGTDTYTATVTGVTAYNDADAYLIRFTNGNTTGATLNINGLGAIPLYRNNDGPLLGGDILDGGEMLCIYNSTLVEFQVIGISPNSLIAYVTNDDSVTLTKGMPVYAFSGQGDRMTVKRANNTGDATSAQTVGLVMSTSIAANQKGVIMMQGLLDGLSILPTATWNDGDPVYLGATDGSITNVKPYAPNHLVYLGVVTTASNGSAGRMYVRIQNGYELSEIHDIDLITNAPTNNEVLTYESSTDLWKNKSIGTILGYTPYKFVDTTQVTYLGSVIGLTETIVSQTTILGNTLTDEDLIKKIFRITKGTTLGNVNIRLKVNTSNTLVGATQIGLFTLTTSYKNALMYRHINLYNGNAYCYSGTANIISDIIGTNATPTTFTYDTTADLYVFFTVQLANVADEFTFQLAYISN